MFINTGTLTIQDGLSVSAQSDSGSRGEAGSIAVNATNRFTIEDASTLSVATQGSERAGDVTINTPLLIVDSDADITATATATAAPTSQGGNITLNASDMRIAGRLGVLSETQGDASAGTLALKPYPGDRNLDIRLRDTARISASTSANGDGGDLTIMAPDSISIQGDGRIAVETTGSGDAGTLRLDARNLTIGDEAILTAASNGGGNAGDIDMVLRGRLTLQGGAEVSVSSSDNATAGDLQIMANRLVLRDGANLSAETESGRGANIELTVGDRLTLNASEISASTANGTGGNITLNEESSPATLLRLRNNSTLSTETTTGDAGRLGLHVNTLTLDRSRLSARATQSGGTAGDIAITAHQVTINNGGAILASNQNVQVGGNINLLGLDTLDLNDGTISAATRTGRAGNIEIAASNQVRLQNESELSVETDSKEQNSSSTVDSSQARHSVFSTANTAPPIPNAGNLLIQADSLDVEGGSQILVQSPNGQAGNIEIGARRVQLNDGIISAATNQNSPDTPNSATINIRDLDLLVLENNSLISARAEDGAAGGNINIVANDGYIAALPLNNSDIIATAEQSQGGEINISVDQLFGFTLQEAPATLRTNQTNDISASSAAGPQGVVNINTVNVDPDQGLVALPVLLDDSPPLNSICTAVVEGGSKFTLIGRGGLPATPTDVASAIAPWEDWYIATPDDTSSTTSHPANAQPSLDAPRESQITEAQGWAIAPDGTAQLVAQTQTTTPTHGSLQPPNCLFTVSRYPSNTLPTVYLTTGPPSRFRLIPLMRNCKRF